jgi:hypothetical protein
MTTAITTPDLKFSGFYYPQVVADLIRWKRQNMPDLKSENPYDPVVQLLRAFALATHYGSVRLDGVAQESIFGTTRTRRALANHLALIDYRIKRAVPATTELLYKLSQPFTPLTEIIPDNALAATKPAGATAATVFETDEAVSVQATNLLTACFSFDDGGAAYTDITASVNVGAAPVALLPAVPAIGDMLYIGHADVMVDRLDFGTVSIPMADVSAYVWEVYDGSTKDGNPDLVQDLGGTIQFDVDVLLGADNAAGSTVRVYYNPTDSFEDCVSTYAGGKNIITTAGTLGQIAVSLAEEDYTVGTLWRPITDLIVEDTSAGITTAGYLSFAVPKFQTLQWQTFEVNAVEAYWIRLRVVAIGGGPIPPTVDRILITGGEQYVAVAATQGRTINDAGTNSTGAANQSVLSANPNVVDLSGAVSVTTGAITEAWTRVANFLASGPLDKHFTTTEDDEEFIVFAFGDGVTGKVPPAASTILPSYRIEAETDGNVGANTIVVNRSGLSLITSVSNLIPASGWAAKQGHDAADIENMKIIGPAALRAITVSAPIDFESKAVDWTDDDGASPVIRARAVEEGYGIKTIQLLVVGAGGALLSSAVRADLQDYYNNDDDGVIIANHQATVDNYTPQTIAITVEVTGITAAQAFQVQNQLTAFLSPVSQDDSGNWVWAFAGTVAHSRLEAETYKANSSISNVTVTAPAADVVLGANALPAPGAITVVII